MDGIKDGNISSVEQIFVKLSGMIERQSAEVNGKLELHAYQMKTILETVQETKADFRDMRDDLKKNYATKEDFLLLKNRMDTFASKGDLDGVRSDLAPFKKGWGEAVRFVFYFLAGAFLSILVAFIAAGGKVPGTGG